MDKRDYQQSKCSIQKRSNGVKAKRWCVSGQLLELQLWKIWFTFVADMMVNILLMFLEYLNQLIHELIDWILILGITSLSTVEWWVTRITFIIAIYESFLSLLVTVRKLTFGKRLHQWCAIDQVKDGLSQRDKSDKLISHTFQLEEFLLLKIMFMHSEAMTD